MLQIKDKPVHEVVLGIIGMNAGNGRLADTFGSLTCVSEDGRLLVNVSGFTDEERSEIVRDWSKWAYSSIGVKFKDVITSKSSDLYSLFEPRYAGPRFDKAPDTTESILERYYKG
jgi:ATP-dependent DNA ligase